MKTYPLSVQLYSVREEAKKDFFSVLKRIASFGYQGVEFAGFHGHNPKDIKKVLDDLGLKTSSIHGPIPNASNVNEIIDTAGLLGYQWHVCGWRDGFTNKETTLKVAEEFQKAAELLNGSGIKFCTHNHDFEFDKNFDGKTPHQVMMAAAPSVYAEIDTYWVAVGGKDPASVIKEYGKRVPLLHIKDGPIVKGKNMTAVGDGLMKWEPVIKAAESASVEWLIVELDSCDTDMMEAVKKSRNYLLSKGCINK